MISRWITTTSLLLITTVSVVADTPQTPQLQVTVEKDDTVPSVVLPQTPAVDSSAFIPPTPSAPPVAPPLTAPQPFQSFTGRAQQNTVQSQQTQPRQHWYSGLANYFQPLGDNLQYQQVRLLQAGFMSTHTNATGFPQLPSPSALFGMAQQKALNGFAQQQQSQPQQASYQHPHIAGQGNCPGQCSTVCIGRRDISKFLVALGIECFVEQFITSVLPGSAAARADLRAGDQIVMINGCDFLCPDCVTMSRNAQFTITVCRKWRGLVTKTFPAEAAAAIPQQR